MNQIGGSGMIRIGEIFRKARLLFFSLFTAVLLGAALFPEETHATSDLYVSDYDHGGIAHYDGVTGDFIGSLVPNTTLSRPSGLVFGPDRNLYVAETGNNRVVRFNGITGAFIDYFVPTGSGGLDSPWGLTFGPGGNLFVTSSGNNKVLRYNGTSGAFIDEFASSGSGGLSFPYALLFGPDGNLYVTSYTNSKVIRYDFTTRTPSDFVTSGSGALNGPEGLVFGADNNLYVSSYLTSKVIKYNGTTGQPIGNFVNSGVSGPTGVEFGPNDDNLYVLDFLANKVRRFNYLDGSFINDFVTSGGLSRPSFLAFGPRTHTIAESVIVGSGSISCNPNPVEETTASLCVMSPSLLYHVTDVKVGPAGSLPVSVGPLWTYKFSDVMEDKNIEASFGSNYIWVFYHNTLMQIVTTAIDSAVSYAAANNDTLVRVQQGAYFEGSGTGVKCGSGAMALSGGWADYNTDGTAPTVIAPTLTVSGSCMLIIDEITIQ